MPPPVTVGANVSPANATVAISNLLA